MREGSGIKPRPKTLFRIPQKIRYRPGAEPDGGADPIRTQVHEKFSALRKKAARGLRLGQPGRGSGKQARPGARGTPFAALRQGGRPALQRSRLAGLAPVGEAPVGLVPEGQE